MSLPTLPWWKPELTGGEQRLIQQVLESNFLNDGDFTTRFEGAIAGVVGANHAIATTSGTSAIFLALAAAGVGAGDEVIVPDVTFIATANAVALTGATVVLVDVEPQGLTVCPSAFQSAITSRTRAVVPVHVSGRNGSIEEVCAIARAKGIAVVEDAAEALWSRRSDRYLGTWGDAGCFSFSPNKTISTGQGGMVVTNDDALASRLRQLKDQGRPVRGTGGDDEHPCVGYNFKLTNLQAAVGLAQLEALEARCRQQILIQDCYRAGLAELNEIRLMPFDLAAGECPQWTDAEASSRNELVSFLEGRGMGCRRFWHPLHTQAPYRRSPDGFPVSSKVGPRALWLPSAFQTSADDVRRVCETIREFYRQADSTTT